MLEPNPLLFEFPNPKLDPLFPKPLFSELPPNPVLVEPNPPPVDPKLNELPEFPKLLLVFPPNPDEPPKSKKFWSTWT